MKGPLYYARARVGLRARLRAKGYGFWEINHIVGGADNDTVDLAETMTSEKMGPTPVGQIGDGSILKAIEDFFATPFGQALLAALEKLVLGLLV